MRNLSRIIFINSANIPYSDDIYLDGNVHFIGTQGVGKSTLLRAILFFYNADTQRLGISVEKQNYTDYYFPYSNSYIVYEVATENGAFCILSFKSMNRVCYRFIHSPYRKEFFIDENRVAYSESDRVRAVLDQYGIEYSRIIYTYDEYRNILYGNSTSPEFSRYSLMESKQYQNIPRTIQNVLLNSKLDAEFIKKTIISSLNEDETAIDLNSYKEHLKNFETRLKDIEEFQKRETRKQAREITLLSQQTSKLQGGLVQNCRELVAAFRKAESILPQWKEKQDRTDADKGKLIELGNKQFVFFAHRHIGSPLFNDTKEQIADNPVEVLFDILTTHRVVDIEYEFLILKGSIEDIEISFLPGIISFFVFQIFVGIFLTRPFQQIINVLEMIIESHAVESAVFGDICNGDFVERLLKKQFLQRSA